MRIAAKDKILKVGESMAEFALEIRSLTKKINKKLIIDDVSFAVKKGEVFGLLGPNGAGKTTIIKMITGLARRTAGKVFVNGYDLDQEFKKAISEIGAIVENPEFYGYMSGYQNLKHYANMAAKKITKERIEEVARMVGLEKAIHHKVKTYSLGMRQRLGIAQAILHEPSLLILDEPTNGLDPQGIKEVRDYLRALAKAGTAVIVSSHLLSEMQLMCDRFAIIEKGKLIQISSIADLNGGKKEGQKVIFEVDDAKTAILILRRNDWAKEDQLIDQQQFSVKLAKEDVAKANRLLVNRGVKVYGIRTETTTLEDHFLKLTGNGEEGGMSRAAAN